MGDKIGIVIGIENYRDVDGVEYAKNDATEVAKSLAKLGVDVRYLLIDQQATRNDILTAIDTVVVDLTQHDAVYFSYSGHGIKPENGVNYLTCWDYRKDSPVQSSISVQYIFGKFVKSKCKKVIFFLDACHSGVLLKDSSKGLLDTLSPDELVKLLKDSEYYACFSSCRHQEKSWPDPKLRHGIWTYFLIKALSGTEPAAQLKDGLITAESLQLYLAKSVKEHIKGLSWIGANRQNPIKNDSKTKDFVIVSIPQSTQKRVAHFRGNRVKSLSFLAQDTKLAKHLLAYNRNDLIEAIQRGSIDDEDDTRGIVSNFAHQDVSEEIDKKFELIRDSYGLKRKDITCSPADGEESNQGWIKTPDLTYFFDIDPDEEDDDECILQREVRFKSLSTITSPATLSAFKNIFDTVKLNFSDSIDLQDLIDELEDLDADELNIDYERDCEFVDVDIDGQDPTLRFYAEHCDISLAKGRPIPQLFEAALNLLEAVNKTCHLGIELGNLTDFRSTPQ